MDKKTAGGTEIRLRDGNLLTGRKPAGGTEIRWQDGKPLAGRKPAGGTETRWWDGIPPAGRKPAGRKEDHPLGRETADGKETRLRNQRFRGPHAQDDARAWLLQQQIDPYWHRRGMSRQETLFSPEEDHTVLPVNVEFVEHPGLTGRHRAVARGRQDWADESVDGVDAGSKSDATP